MKRIFAGVLCVLLLLASAGCSSDSTAQNKDSATASEPDVTTESTELPAPSKEAIMESSSEEPTGQKTSVIYFSGTGNTAAIAQMMAKALNASIYEIVPVEPYTSDDLNYNTDNCRANQEQNDNSARPEIAGDLSEIESSDTIYLGYPIWWGTNPKIIETFLDTYDLSTVTVYTFCTSGSSGIENSVTHLQEQYPEVNIVSGHRFPSGAGNNEIENWLKELQ